VYILPYIEQNNIYQQWQFTGSSGYTNANNENLIGGTITIPIYRCPSSPAPDRGNRGGNNPAGGLMVDSYSGVAGSVIPGVPGVSVVYNNNCCNSGTSLASDTGTLYAQSKVKLTDITDGTSNTMVVGELGDHVRDPNRQPIIIGYTSGFGPTGLYMWPMGAANTPNPATLTSDYRHFNCVSVRYSINQVGIIPAGTKGTDATAHNAGLHNDGGTNFPFSSGHSGGVNGVMGDGSVRFMSNSTSLITLSGICTRAGGEVLLNQ
jgi:hypothetical protein